MKPFMKPLQQTATRALSAALLPLMLMSALTLLGYSPQAQADSITRTSSFEYDTTGLLIKEVVEPDVANNCLQTSYTYDSWGNKTGVSTATCAGASAPATTSFATPRTASSSYSANSVTLMVAGTSVTYTTPAGLAPTASTNALGQSETKTYEARFGQLTSLTGPNQLATTWQYDSFGRKTKEIRADGTSTTWAYKLCTDTSAPLPSCPGPIAGATSVWVAIEQSYATNQSINAPQKRQYYDTLNRVVRVQTQGFDGISTAPSLLQDTEYNARGQVARQSNLYASGGTPVWTSYTYDALGRTTSQSQPDPVAAGGIATTSYTYNGLTTSVTNAKSQSKTTVKNAQGQVAVITDAQGSTITYTYDALGQLTQTNAAGSITTMSYNQRGHKVAMLDPAMGSWTYTYNAAGELVSQRDSLNQSTTMLYDNLGRMTQRTEPDLVSEWSYDKYFDQSACSKGVGKLCEARSNNSYNRKHTYDSLGRASTTATVLDNASVPATVSETYDANTGRVATKTWPTGYQASYVYSPLGYLKSVTAGGTAGFTQTVSYTIQAMNAQGQITQYKTGNLVTTVKTIDAITQRLSALSATKDGQSTGNVLNQSYTYDTLGNLMTRADNSVGVGTQESFSYDSLNRLTTATLLGGAVSPPTTTEVKYDARGNIAYKSDVGRYWYDAARPNRMTNVTLETAPGAIQALTGTRTLSYAFDDYQTGAQSVNTVQMGNGNLMYTVSQDTANSRHSVREESYTSFNMPNVIKYGNFITNTSSTQDRTLSFVYGPEHQRIKQNVLLTGNGTSSYFAGNVWYLNGTDSLGLTYEKEVRTNGTTEHKHYVSAGGVNFAIFSSRTGTLNGLSATTTSYLHEDHLNSISAITDESGAVTERLAYDPWGKRRNINTAAGTPDNLDAIVGQKTERGYTEHEHLDEIGVIHMNGRIYDPLVGRFMSADPTIQAPYNLKSFNRYSYVWNNPLQVVDPTGFEGVMSSYDYQGSSGMLSGQANEWSSSDTYSRSDNAYQPVTVPDYSPDSTAKTRDKNAEATNGFVIAATSYNQNQMTLEQYQAAYKALPWSLRSFAEDFVDKTFNTFNPVTGVAVGVAAATKRAAALEKGVVSGWQAALDAVKGFFGIGAENAAKSGLEGANFAQKTFGSMFSKGGAFAGQSVDDVAGALRSGAMKPSQVPIDYVVREGNTLILNTRSAQALEVAGVPRSSWTAVNRTGQEAFESMLSGQLQRNGLTSEGIATVRRSGGM